MFCKVCNHTLDPEDYKIKEMHLGLREEFIYQKCPECGIMQLTDIPNDLSRYYPSEQYYSFKSNLKGKAKTDIFRKWKAEYLLFNKNKFLGRILTSGYKIPDYFHWLKEANILFNDSILDVGAGNGSLLQALAKNGFTNLKGIDPYNKIELDYGKFKVEKKNIFQLDGQFDFIMLNHAFEHMDEPKKVMNRLFELLKPGKYLLIRTPVMGSKLWERYKENWMQLDAPRHIIIHTEKSMQFLSGQSGFELKKIVYDSTEVSFLISEQYEMGIPLNDPDSYAKNKETTLFTKSEISDFKDFARQMNAQGQGDQAAFYLYKPF